MQYETDSTVIKKEAIWVLFVNPDDFEVKSMLVFLTKPWFPRCKWFIFCNKNSL